MDVMSAQTVSTWGECEVCGKEGFRYEVGGKRMVCKDCMPGLYYATLDRANRLQADLDKITRHKPQITMHMADCGHGVTYKTRIDAAGRSYCPDCAEKRLEALENWRGAVMARLQKANAE